MHLQPHISILSLLMMAMICSLLTLHRTREMLSMRQEAASVELLGYWVQETDDDSVIVHAQLSRPGRVLLLLYSMDTLDGVPILTREVEADSKNLCLVKMQILRTMIPRAYRWEVVQADEQQGWARGSQELRSPG